MTEQTDVAVVGAGPYGLSLAAHIAAANIEFRIFGRSMDAWRNHMPEGMLLKSDGFASNLYDPAEEFPLSRYCQERGIDYDDEREAVQLETFLDYGRVFGSRFAPNLDERLVASIAPAARGFGLRLENGEALHARRVVLAIGIGHFPYTPPNLAALAPELGSHSYEHHKLAKFGGRRVAVVGGGASAIDLASLLQERGCEAQLICRGRALKFGTPTDGKRRSLWQRIRHPRSGLGPGLRSRLCTDAPLLFHALPAPLRLEIVRRHLGPFASWRMRDKFAKCAPALTGHEILSAQPKDRRVELSLKAPDGRTVLESFDHVIAATGYRVDLRRLSFLDSTLQAALARVNETPVLSSRFESSVKGLFFVGPVAANSFGPLMRFAFGARFASRRLIPCLGRQPEAAHGSPRNLTVLNGETAEPNAP
jgi:thioredoxin reductase